MLREKRIELASFPYGDVCKRSSIALRDSGEFEEFEKDLLEVIEQELAEDDLIENN